jgi:hypothetical protein
MNDEVMAAHRVPQVPCQPVEVPLQPGVLEWSHAPAAIADGVVMMLTSRGDGFESRDALAELDSLDEPHFVEELQRSIDARHADVASRLMKLVRDLVRREAAALTAQQGDDCAAGAAGAMAGGLQRTSGRVVPICRRPVGHGGRLAAN